MKKILIMFMLLITFSCSDNNTPPTTKSFDFNSNDLPNEIKGLKIYTIWDEGRTGYTKVATLNGRINSITYPIGKSQETVILIDESENKIFEVSKIILETDSLIICRKKLK